MWRRFIHIWRGLDVPLAAIMALLLCVGLAALYSSSLSRGDFDIFNRQLLSAGLGVLVFFITASVDYRVYRSWSRFIYIFSLLLLILVLFLGREVNGTIGWFRLFGFSFQPVEMVKLLWILAFSSYLAHVGPPLTAPKTVMAIVLVLPLLGLVLTQPDFGSAFIILIIWGVLLAIVPKNRRWWIIMGSLGLLVIILGSFFLKDYQRDRLKVFFNPRTDALGRGYNVSQSVIAVGSGGWWGRGLGLGTQSKLHFLPEQHTDFIFASIAEELGFVGAGLILLLWAVFFARIIWLIRRLRDDFAILIAVGIFVIFSAQTIFNIGMNMGVAPVVGITLPFLSYGGSSLIMSMAAVGLLENLALQFGSRAPVEAHRVDRERDSMIY